MVSNNRIYWANKKSKCLPLFVCLTPSMCLYFILISGSGTLFKNGDPIQRYDIWCFLFRCCQIRKTSVFLPSPKWNLPQVEMFNPRFSLPQVFGWISHSEVLYHYRPPVIWSKHFKMLCSLCVKINSLHLSVIIYSQPCHLTSVTSNMAKIGSEKQLQFWSVLHGKLL